MKTREIALSGEARRVLVALVVAGAGAMTVGLVVAPSRAWSAYLVSAFYFLTLALGGLAFLALLHVTNAGWGVVVKRVAEGFAGYLPVGAASMLAVLAGARSLYRWTEGADPELHAKAAYLNLPAFTIRMVVALGLWVAFARLLRRSSLAQDGDGSPRHTRRSVAVSAVFLLVFAYSFSMASFDWMMSLEPHWASTVFAFYNMAGLLTGGLAALTVAVIVLRRTGLLPEVGAAHLHDLGKLVFGMSTFWAYLWISQYLLIWYANIPEETAWYLARTGNGWAFLFYANLVLSWGLPFLMLLPRAAKRSESQLLRVAGILLLGRFVDLYLMVAPAAEPEHRGIGVLEVATFAGFAALFVLVVVQELRRAPLIAPFDPYLVESLHHHS
jgi:hypothetical protein